MSFVVDKVINILMAAAGAALHSCIIRSEMVNGGVGTHTIWKNVTQTRKNKLIGDEREP